MKQIFIIWLVFSSLIGLVPSNASANIDAQHPSLTGRHYAKMSLDERVAYVTGVVHGMTLARPIDDGDDMVPWLHNCIANLPPDQLDRVVGSYIKKHPELNDAGLDVLTFLAFQKNCRKKR